MGSLGDGTHSPDAVHLWAASTSGKSLLTSDQSSTLAHAWHAGCSSPWPPSHSFQLRKPSESQRVSGLCGSDFRPSQSLPRLLFCNSKTIQGPRTSPMETSLSCCMGSRSCPLSQSPGTSSPSSKPPCRCDLHQGPVGERDEGGKGSRDLAPVSASRPAG